MTFDALVNHKMLESDIYYRSAEILQRNFFSYKDVNICLPLNEANGDICSVKEVRFYNLYRESDVAAKHEFMFKGEYRKAYVISKYFSSFYRMSLFGHFTTITADIYLNEIRDIEMYRRTKDIVLLKSVNYEMAVGAFNEITAELKKISS